MKEKGKEINKKPIKEGEKALDFFGLGHKPTQTHGSFQKVKSHRSSV